MPYVTAQYDESRNQLSIDLPTGETLHIDADSVPPAHVIAMYVRNGWKMFGVHGRDLLRVHAALIAELDKTDGK
jgi:hypothetical protein